MKLIPHFINRRIAHRPNLVKIVDNIGWLFFDKILRMGVGVLVVVWIARYLGPEQFGLLSFAIAFIGLFGAIAGLGLQGVVVRDILREPDRKDTILGTAAALQFIGGLIAYGLILGAIFWLRPGDTLAKTLVAILGSAMLFKASDVAVYWFESQVLSKYTVWMQSSSFIVFALIKVALILEEAPLIAFAWVTMAEALVVATLMLVMLGMRGPRLRQLQANLSCARRLISDSWPLIVSGVAITIYMKVDQIMLGQMVGDEGVGIYSAAVRISEVWYFVPMTIAASVFPAILEAKAHNEQQYYDRLQKLYDHLTMLAVTVAVTMAMISSPLISLLFGDAYKNAGTVLAIHIWAGIFISMGVARGKWLLAENLQYMGYWYVGIGMCANVVGNYLVIPLYGVTGAAVTTLFSQVVATIIAPALYPKTRLSSLMLMRSLSPAQWKLRAYHLARFKASN